MDAWIPMLEIMDDNDTGKIFSNIFFLHFSIEGSV